MIMAGTAYTAKRERSASRWWPPPLPREHGAWAMLLTPVMVAVAALGPDRVGLLAMLGWICAYSLRGPIELLRGAGPTGRAGMARGSREAAVWWLVILGAAGLGLLGWTVLLRPNALPPLLVAGAVLVLVHFLADRGHVRTILTETLSIAGLMAGLPLYYLTVTGGVGREGWILTLGCFAFFFGSIFRVKSVARERLSVPFGRLSVAVHVAFVVGGAAAVVWADASLLLPVALLLPAVWAIRCARVTTAINLKRVGFSEVGLSLLFAVLLAGSAHI